MRAEPRRHSKNATQKAIQAAGQEVRKVSSWRQTCDVAASARIADRRGCALTRAAPLRAAAVHVATSAASVTPMPLSVSLLDLVFFS